MHKDNIDVEFEIIDGKKDLTFSLEQENKRLFNEYLVTKDAVIIDKITKNLLREDYYITSEMKRMGSLVKIIIEEISDNASLRLVDGVSTYQELHDKYIMAVLLLRRIEMAANDEFSSISYEVLPGLGIHAILEIIKSEYYARRMYILKKLFEVCKNEMPDEIKLVWLYKFIEKYPDEYWYLEMAELYLDYGQHVNALMFLEKIERPNDEIKDLIETLRECVGGAM